MWGLAAVGAHVLFMQALRLYRHLYIAAEDNAETVYKLLFSVEFPYVWLKGLELALFNTFPHAGVFRRLTINRKFTQAPERRYDDTELLLREAWEHGVHSRRGRAAMARLNEIHSHFNIDNDSYLYVLALFVVTPIRLINEVEFRRLTPHEISSECRAISMMGRAMNIKAVPKTFSEYERVVDGVYASSQLQIDLRGRAIADAVMEMLLRPFPHVRTRLHAASYTPCWTIPFDRRWSTRHSPVQYSTLPKRFYGHAHTLSASSCPRVRCRGQCCVHPFMSAVPHGIKSTGAPTVPSRTRPHTQQNLWDSGTMQMLQYPSSSSK